MDRERLIEEALQKPHTTQTRETRWYTHVGDFMNTLKAFIGINYQSLPFAFAQCGLVFGLVGVLLIAALTNHCCQLLVSCKKLIIRRVCAEVMEERSLSCEDMDAVEEHLQRSIGYGDVGRFAFGDWCYRLIQVAVWLTQFIILIIYFVFIANTVQALFPLKPHPPNSTNASFTTEFTHTTATSSLSSSAFTDPCEMKKNWDTALCRQTNIGDLENNNGARLNGSRPNSRLEESLSSKRSEKSILNSWLDKSGSSSGVKEAESSSRLNEIGLKLDLGQKGLKEGDSFEEALGNSDTKTDVTTAPDLRFLVLFPLPFFILTSMVRRLRMLAPLSVIATVALVVGAISVGASLGIGFTVSDDYVLITRDVRTIPIFLTMMISSYEGIGCVLPIDSSMAGSRHLLPGYLKAAVYLIFVVLCTFGSLGYVRYGPTVQQIIVLELTQHSLVAMLVDVTLIISVLFTYPLQSFPVIEITERFLFTQDWRSKWLFRSCCSGGQTTDQHVHSSNSISERAGLLNDGGVTSERTGLLKDVPVDREEGAESIEVKCDRRNIDHQVNKEVASWKRSLTRLLLTIFVAGLAILLRENFAYLGSFSGAIGASLLALILPCCIHLKLQYSDMSKLCVAKDVLIILFSTTCSVLGLFSIGSKLV